MTLSLFMMAALALLLFLSLVIVWPWLRATPASVSLLQLNITVFRERLAELDADQQAGRLDQEAYQAQKIELERQLLAVTDSVDLSGQRRAPRLVVGLVFLWLPLMAIAGYVLIGDRQPVYAYWQALDQYDQVAEQLLTGQIESPPESVTDAIGLLQAMQTHVYRNPTDAQRWLAMSQAYVVVEAIESALEALSRAQRRAPEDDQIAMTYAQMRFFSQEGQVDEKTKQVLDGVLTRNAQHEGALLLLAMGKQRAGDYPVAIDYLNRIKAIRLNRDPDMTAAAIVQLNRAIEQAQQLQHAAQSSRIEVSVSLAAALREQLKPSDTLFVYVRALQGATIPYAVHKQDVALLLAGQTVNVVLSDQNAMMAERSISSARRDGLALAVGARISQTGNPTGAAGDLESLPVPLGAEQQFQVLIDRTR